MTAATAPQREIGYAQNTAHGGYWWTLEDETTPELVWPNSVVVYDSMRRTDSQVASVLRAVTLPVRRTPWRIDPNGARDEVVEHVATDLGLPIVGAEAPKAPPRMRDRFSWPEHLRQALLMLPYGHSYFEMTYRVDKDGNRAHLHKLAPRPAKTIERIEVARDGGLVWIKQYPSGPGGSGDSQKPIPVSSLVAYIHDREGGNWLGTSVLRPAYKNWLLKDRLLRVQAQTIERNGMGIPLYKAQENASEADITAGRDMATAWRAGEAAGSAIPFGADLVLRGVEGTLPDAEKVVRYHDEQIARAVLAHFLNLGTQTGSWALGTTFADFFTLSLQTLAQQIADTATMHVIEDLVDANWGEDEPAPRLVFDEIGSRQAATAAAIKSLIDAGAIQLDGTLEEMLRQQYGLPPRDPEAVAAQEDEAAIDADAMVAAIDAFRGGGAQPVAAAAGPNFNRLHPRGAKGRFRDTFSRILDGLTKWAAAGGEGDPFDGFEREPLRRVAVARGITLRRGASRDDVADALLGHLREALAGKPDDDDEPEAKPPAKKAVKKAAPRKRTPAKAEPGHGEDHEAALPARPLSPEASEIVGDYHEGWSANVNSALRTGEGDVPPGDARAARIARGMDEIMAGQSLPRDIEVERGIPVSALTRLLGGEPTVGSTYTDHGFVSTTTTGRPRLSVDEESAVLRIRVPKGTSALSTHRTGERGELDPGEVVLDRGLTYRVTGVEVRDGRQHVEVEVVPDGPPAKKAAPEERQPRMSDAEVQQIINSTLTDEGKRRILTSNGVPQSEWPEALRPQPVKAAPKPTAAEKLAAGYPDVPPGVDVDEDEWAAMSYSERVDAIVSARPDPEQSARDRQADTPAKKATARPSGLPENPTLTDYEDLADRLSRVPGRKRAEREEQILAQIEDLSAGELTKLAGRFGGGYNTQAGKTVKMRFPEGLSIDERRRWLAHEVSADQSTLAGMGRRPSQAQIDLDREFDRLLAEQDAPDPTQSARDRQSDTPAKKATADVASVRARLATVASQESAREYIDGLGLSGPQLRDLAEQLDVPFRSDATKAQIRDTIVQVHVLGRLLEEVVKGRSGSGRFENADLDEPTGVDPEQQARDRQSDIDSARRYADVAGELDQILHDGGSDTAVLARLDAAGKRHGIAEELAPAREALVAGDQALARERLGAMLTVHGVRPYEAAGDTTTFDRTRHESTTRLSDGAQVEVIRPGYTLDRDGESIRLSKATVEAAPDEVPADEVPAAGGVVSGAKSSVPVLRNHWGEFGAGEIGYHEDGRIGLALRGMGDDRLIDVDGEPLANVLGRLATDGVRGRKTSEEVLQGVRDLRDRMPEGSRARQELDDAVEELDAPPRSPLPLPAGTPAPLVALMKALSRIPLARREVDRFGRREDFNEMDMLADLVRQFHAGEISNLRLANEVRRKLENHRHESEEGKFEIDRAVRAAMDELDAMRKAGRGSPASQAPPPDAPSVDPLSDLRSLPDPEAIRDALDLRKIDGPDGLKALIDAASKQSGTKISKSGRKRDLVDRLVEHLGGGTVSPEERREIEVENRIRAAYRALQGRTDLPEGGSEFSMMPGMAPQRLMRQGGYVSIADLRDELGEDLPRGEIDAALKRIAIHDPGANAVPESAQASLTDHQRAGALRFGDQDKHWLIIDDPSDRPLPGGSPSTPEAPRKRTPAKKAVPRKSVAPTVTDAAGATTAPVAVRGSLAGAGTAEEIGAVFAREAKDITGRTVSVDMAGADPQIAREHAEGILRGMERYPDVWVAQVVTFGPGGARPDMWEDTSVDRGVHAAAGIAPLPGDFAFLYTIGFAAYYANDPAGYRESLRVGDASGWTVRGGPVRVALHEFGHLLAGHTVAQTAAKRIATERARAVGEKPSAHIRSQVSQYAATDAGELAAEAFADVMLHGEDASELSRAIVAEIDRRYRIVAADLEKRRRRT